MNDLAALAEEVLRLFPRVYLLLHRRQLPKDRVTPQSWAVLHHLAMTGPLTIGEMARHLDRAQSVVTEIVDRLEERGLLARMRDERDRRRTLVWLTELGHSLLREEKEVLDRGRLSSALSAMPAAERGHLLTGMKGLISAAESLPIDTQEKGNDES